MTKQFWFGLIIGIVLSGIVGGIIGISMVGKEATVEPPDWEEYMINRLKNLKIPEAPLPSTPVEASEENLLEGGERYNHLCAVCHDLSGDADSAFAEGFYPKVADLTANYVQRYSDRQLKWIVENGIRFTGMPGWKEIVDQEAQWKIVYYLRVLGDPEQADLFRTMLMESGKWEVEAPAGHEHHEEGEGHLNGEH